MTIGGSSTLLWTITTANGACTATLDSVIINVDSSTTIAAAGADQDLCDTTTTTLSANTHSGSETGTWTVISGTAVVTSVNDPVSGVTGLTIGGTSILRWTISTAFGGCAATTDDVTINVDSATTVSDAGSDQNLCGVTTTTLASNTPAGSETGTWTVISGTAVVTSVNDPVSGVTGLTIGGSSILRWTISTAFGGCAATTDDVVINSDPGTTISIAGPDQNLCNDTTTILAANTPSGSEAGTWTVIAGTAVVTSVNSPSSGVTGLTIGGSSTLRWTITTASGGCADSFDDVIINSDPTTTVSDAGPDQNLCNITTATLAANATAGSETGTWTIISGTALVTSVNDPLSGVTGLTIGGSSTLRWTITSGYGGCAASFDNVTINVDPTTTVSDAGSDQNLCNTTTAILAANTPAGGETGTWSVIAGTAVVTSVNNPTSGFTGLTIGGSSTLLWTISTANGGCAASLDSITINADSSTTTAAAGSDQDLCDTTGTILAANTPAGSETGTWSVISGTAVVTDVNDPASEVTGLTIGGSSTLRWTITTAFGSCAATTDDVTIDVDPIITVSDAGPDQNLCNTTTTLAANTPAGSETGTWSVVSGSAIVTNVNYPASGVTGLIVGDSSVLRWTITSSFGGCAATLDSVTINVDPVTTAAVAGTDQNLCDTTSTTLTANTPAGGETGTWSVISGTAIATSINNPNSGITGLTIGGSATLRWTITSSSGGCTATTDDVTINVDSAITISAAGPDQNLCNITSTTLSANSPVGSETGTWSVISGTANVANLNDPASIVTGLTIGDSTSLRWTITSINGGCVTIDDVTIIIDSTTTIAAAGPDQNLCNITTATLAANTPAGSETGTWSVISGTVVVANVNDPSSSVTGLTIGVSSTLRWTITSANGACPSTTDDVIINVDSSITIAVAGSDQNHCDTSTAVLAANTPAWSETGTWSVISGTAIVTNINDPNSMVTGLTIGDTSTFRWTITTTNGGCINSTDDIMIIITPLRIVDAGSDTTICEGDSYTLNGLMGGSTSSITWSSPTGGTFDDSTLLNVTYTPSVADISSGSVILTATTDSGGACLLTTDSMVLTINSAPVVNAGLDTTICAGVSYTITGASQGGSATSITWSSPTNGTFDDSTLLGATYIPSAADIAAGNVTLSIVTNDPDAAGPCVLAIDSLVITIIPFIVVDAGVNLFSCANNPNVVLNGSVTGGTTTGEWLTLGSGTFVDSSDFSTTYMPDSIDTSAGFVNLVLTSTNNGICLTVTDTVLLTISGGPNMDAGQDTTVCANDPVLLSGSIISGAGGGVWTSSGTGIFLPDSTDLNATYIFSAIDTSLASLTLWLSSTNAPGCTVMTDSIIVTIAPAINVDAGPDVSVCANNDTVSLSGSIWGSTSTGQWTTSGTGVFFPDSSQSAIYYLPSDADTILGNITLWLTSTNNGTCSTVSDSLIVTITTPPGVDAGPDLMICKGDSVPLNGIVSGSAGTILWTTTGTGIFDDSTLLSAIYAPSTPDTISGSILFGLESTNNGNCVPDYDTIMVTFAAPVMIFAGIDTTVCANNDTIYLNGSVTGSTNTGRWLSSGTGTFLPHDSALTAIYLPSASDDIAGNVIINLMATKTCYATSSFTITITPAPNVIAGSDTIVCISDTSVALNGSVSGGATTGVWTTLGTGAFVPDTTLNATDYIFGAADSIAGSVILVLTSSNNGNCLTVTDTMIVTMTSLPIVDAGISFTFCANNADIILNGSVTGSTSTGIWTTSGSGTFSPDNTTLNALYSPSPADTATGGVTLVLTSTNSCMNFSDSVIYTYTPAPQVDAGPDDTVCANNPNVLLNGSVTVATTTGKWFSLGGGTFSPNNTTLNATYTPGSAGITAGNVTLILFSTNNGLCFPESDTMGITITPSPVLDPGSDQYVCNGDDVFLNGSVSGGTSTGGWTSTGSGTFDDSTLLNAVYTPSPADTLAGTVFFLLTSTNNGNCIPVTEIITVTLTTKPIVDAGIDDTVCANNALVSLNGSVSGSTTSGIWTTNGTGTFTDSTDLNTTYTPSSNDISAGTVTLMLYSTNACLITDSVIIIITPAPNVNAGTDDIYCLNNPIVTLNGSITAGATTGVWSTTGTGIFDDPTLLNATYTPSSLDTLIGSINFTLTSTNNGLCLAETDVMNVSFVPPPSVYAGPDQIVCANHYVPLNGNVFGGSGTGQWSTTGSGTFSDINDFNGIYNFSVADTTAKSVSLILTTPASAGCFAVSDTFDVQITPGPYVYAGEDTTVCSNNDTIFIDAIISGGASTGIWTTNGSGVFIPNDSDLTAIYIPSASDADSGSIELILTSTHNGDCFPEDDTIFVTITPAPVVDAGTDQYICNGDFILTGALVSGGSTTGIWTTSGTGTFNDSSLINAIYTPSDNDTSGIVYLILTSTNNGNCLAEIDTMVATLTTKPIVDAGTDDTVCANNTAYILNGSVSGSTTTGVWSTNGTGTFVDSTDLSTTYTPSAADTVAGTVTLTLASTYACLLTDSIILTITPAPIVDAGGDQVICVSDTSVTLNGTISGSSSSGPFTGQWATSGTGSFFPNPTLNAIYYRLSPADSIAGGVTLVLMSTNNGNCLPESDAIVVTLTTIPIVDAGLDDILCANINLNLNGSVLGGASSGQWITLNPDTGIFTPSDTALNATYTFSNGDTAAGGVTLVLISTNSCVIITDTVEITITPSPTVNAFLSSSVCANNDTVQLNSTITTAGGGIWSTLGSGSFTPSDTISDPKYLMSASDISNGNVILVLTTTNNGNCIAETDTLNFNIIPSPVVDAGPNQNVCTDVINVLLTGSVSGGTTTGKWTSSGTGLFVPNDSTLNAIYIPSIADTTLGTATLTLSSTNNGYCYAESDIMIIFWTKRPVVDAGLDQIICSNISSIALSGLVSGGTATGIWTTNGTGTFSPSDTSLNGMYIHSADDISAGSVTLTLTSTNGCSAITDFVDITIYPGPSAAFSYNTANSLTVNFNDLSTIANGNIVQWSWDFGDSYGDTVPNPVHTYSTIGNYSVELIVTSDLNCSDSIVIITGINFVHADFYTVSVCYSEPFIFSDSSQVQGGDSIISWLWNFGDGFTDTIQNTIHIYSTDGNYTVLLTIQTALGFIDTAVQTVKANPYPVAGFTMDNTAPTILQNINFTDNSTGPPISWLWNFGDSTGISTLQNPSYTYIKPGTPVITQIVTNQFGCSDTALYNLYVADIYPPVIPLAFTPNGDGHNDLLWVRGGPFKSLEFKIFNQWGELIFATDDVEAQWDGTKDGADQPIGVYVYTLIGVTINDQTHEKCGDVSLLR
ncbi:MAG: PKD domain-containing protein [Bacteroidota bacterium]